MIMVSSPPRSNSILNRLNPYTSVTQSTFPSNDPDSPSTMLLLELQGNEIEQTPSEQPPFDQNDRIPTPNASPARARRPSFSSEDEDEEGGPPRSIIFGEAIDRKTLSSPSDIKVQISPGPFRQDNAPSSSASRSTSPGPSTISVLASAMGGTSGDPSTSPEQVVAPRLVPTFREVHPLRPEPSRQSSTARKSPRLTNGQGYLDPSIPSPSSRKGKGKAKERSGRRYHSLPHEQIEDDMEPSLGRYAGLGVLGRGGLKKTGLDSYERALWKWVNVDDLDGFLQEVCYCCSSNLLFIVADLTGHSGLCVLQGQRYILHCSGETSQPIVSNRFV